MRSGCAALAFCATVALAANTALGLQVTGQNAASEADGLYVDCSWDGFEARRFHHGDQNLASWPCTQLPQLAPHRKTIVCIGDSITAGSNVQTNESYPANLFGLTHRTFNVLNLGVGGATVQKAPREAYWTLPHWNVALELPFDVAIVQLGTNDAKDLNWIESDFKRDYLDFIRRLVDTHPEAKIMLSIPPPISDERYKIRSDVVNNKLKEVIPSLGLQGGINPALADMQSAFASAKDREQLLQGDNVHPTVAGYTIMAATFVDLLCHELILPCAF